jgi:hypothetical protein
VTATITETDDTILKQAARAPEPSVDHTTPTKTGLELIAPITSVKLRDTNVPIEPNGDTTSLRPFRGG